MKTLFRFCCFLLLASFSLPAMAGTEKSVPVYYVVKNERDNRLQKTEAAFTIHVALYPGGKVVAKEIRLAYNGVNKTLRTDSTGNLELRLKPGKYMLQLYYSADYFEIKTDSIALQPGYRAEVQVNFHSSVEPVICDKPVIYVYPKQTMPVNVKLDFKGELGFTYPHYNKGWDFTGNPDGTIKMNDKKYHYLFWEGQLDRKKLVYNPAEGFLVSKDSLVPFFEATLKRMGLQPNEIEDYITYWVPLMSVNETNYVHFLFNDDCNAYATLNVTPKPDNVFRVFMIWSPGSANRVIPQKMESFKRDGFTVVEWGGTQVKEETANPADKKLNVK